MEKHKNRPPPLSDPKKTFYYKDQKVYAIQSGSNAWRSATIKDIKLRDDSTAQNASMDGSSYIYYVHFLDQNCRMDEWLENSRIRNSLKDDRPPQLQAPDVTLLMSPQMTTRGRQVSFFVNDSAAKETSRPRAESQTDDETILAADRKRIKLLSESVPDKKGSAHKDPTHGAATARTEDPPVKKSPSKATTATDRIPFDRRPKNISKVHFGIWRLEPWYYSPFPCLLHKPHVDRSIQLEKAMLGLCPAGEQGQAISSHERLVQCIVAMSHQSDSFGKKSTPSSTKLPELFVCEFCLESFPTRSELSICHHSVCTSRHPPGNEIYRDAVHHVSVFEIDAVQQRHYCQRLCLLSRLFLEHKCVDFDISPFVFYILTFYDTSGCHALGYFSKEKLPIENNNLSCIMVLPPYQSHGVGKFLIDLCYEISKREGRIGTPERPLSDLGARSYQSYWRDKILDCVLLAEANDGMEISLDYVVQQTGIALKDVVETLVHNNVMEKGSWDYTRNRLGKACTRLFLPEGVGQEHLRRKEQKEYRRRMGRKKIRAPVTLVDIEKRSFPLFNRFLLHWDASLYFLEKV